MITTEADGTPPTIINCPTNLQVTAPIGSQTEVSWTDPTATDDSGGPVTMVRTHASGSTFPPGDTTVTYRFRDQAGNEASCAFTISSKYFIVWCFLHLAFHVTFVFILVIFYV